MPRRQFIDKKTATTFALVHRAQNDPLIHDEDAPSMVFAERSGPAQPRRSTEDDDDYAYSSAGSIYSGNQGRQRGDLEDEFGISFQQNEGQAAEHGVFYDDTGYDYMQHMRDLGSGGGPVAWVEANAPPQQQKGKGKGKQKLEDALRELDIEESAGSAGTQESSAARSLLPEEMLASEFVQRRSYQDQQDIPDEIAGLQPDMDPDLRQVLEALEDDAFVDEDQDFFNELTQDQYEIDKLEYERLGEQSLFEHGDGELPYGEEDDEGWESDDTIKASSPPPALRLPEDGEQAKPPEDVQAPPPADPTEGAWLDEFKKFKSEVKATQPPKAALAPRAPSALEFSALSSLATGRSKKRKGAKTSTSNYSMSSSALARTDHQTLLDSRFDKIEEEYAVDELPDDFNDTSSAISGVSGVTGASKASAASRYSTTSGMSIRSGVSSYSRASDSEAPQLQRADFDSIMDDFLGGYSKVGKMGRRVKNKAPQTGMEQLDEVRSGLGPARVKMKAAGAT